MISGQGSSQWSLWKPGSRLRSMTCKRRMARDQSLLSLPTSCHQGLLSHLQGGVHRHKLAMQAIAEISFIHLAALKCLGRCFERYVCTYSLLQLSPELIIAPESQKIVMRTDSCLSFKKPTISGSRKQADHRDSARDLARETPSSLPLDISEAQPGAH